MDDLETWTVPSFMPTERKVEIRNVDIAKLLVNDANDLVSMLDLDFEYVE